MRPANKALPLRRYPCAPFRQVSCMRCVHVHLASLICSFTFQICSRCPKPRPRRLDPSLSYASTGIPSTNSRPNTTSGRRDTLLHNRNASGEQASPWNSVVRPVPNQSGFVLVAIPQTGHIGDDRGRGLSHTWCRVGRSAGTLRTSNEGSE